MVGAIFFLGMSPNLSSQIVNLLSNSINLPQLPVETVIVNRSIYFDICNSADWLNIHTTGWETRSKNYFIQHLKSRHSTLLASRQTRKLCLSHDAKIKLLPHAGQKSVPHPEAIYRPLHKVFPAYSLSWTQPERCLPVYLNLRDSMVAIKVQFNLHTFIAKI